MEVRNEPESKDVWEFIRKGQGEGGRSVVNLEGSGKRANRQAEAEFT